MPDVDPIDPARASGGPAEFVFPATPGQEALWLLDRVAPGPAYNVPNALAVSGPLDPDALARALQALADRHEALRTVLREEAGRVVQHVRDRVALPLPRHDLAALPPAEREGEAERLRRAHARTPFDLGEGPLVRAALVRLGPERHELLLTFHHAVVDGASVGLLVADLVALYRGAPLGPVALHLAGYGAWQKDRLDGATLEGERAYWRARLADAPAPEPLPVARPAVGAAAESEARGGFASRALPAETAEALRRTARAERATPFAAVLSGVLALAHRYGGGGDLCVGVPFSGRTRPEALEMVGFLVNTVTVRASVSGAEPFRAVVGRVRDRLAEAQAHQELPFAEIVRDLRPDRRSAGSPFFHVMVANDPPAEPPVALGDGASLSVSTLDNGAAKFGLEFRLAESGETATINLVYDEGQYDAPTAERLLEHLVRLLGSAAAEPDRPVAELEMLADDERRGLEALGRGDDLDVPDVPLHALVSAQAARTPDATAVVDGTRRVTYRDLDAAADRLARRLLAVGVAPEDCVGLFTSRSVDLVVGMLGILKAGGAYVPLDPVYPAERVRFVLEDAGVRAVVTQRHLSGLLPDLAAPRLCIDDEAGDGTAPGAAVPLPRVDPAGLAYVIYTSGSTGLPKGVAIEHRQAVALEAWARTVYGPDELRGVLGSTSACFDLSVFEVFVTLASGGTLILAENALSLPTLPAAGEVTLVNTVPSAINALLDVGGLPRSVRTVNLAGEPLRADVVDRLYATRHVARVLDLYGPSEDTTYSTFAARVPGGPEVIGRPVANTTATVLDETGGMVPVGVPGELFLGGAKVARGYLGRPDLTAERFDEEPGRPGVRRYRTGDRVRWRADGALEFLGRADHQVKLRGFRIELGEVETALLALEGVQEAVAVVREDTPGERRLVAYVVGEGDAEFEAGLRGGLARTLPAYMLPEAIVRLEALPQTPNGKVNRGALPPPLDLRPGRDAGFVAPRTPDEEVLAGIVAEVLRIDSIGVHDNLFDAGADSMLVFQISARAQRAGLPLAPRHFFQSQTVAALAREAVLREAALREANLREWVRQMSPEEVRRLLAQKKSSPQGR